MSDTTENTAAETPDDQIHPAARPFLWLSSAKFGIFLVFGSGALAIGLLILEFVIPGFSAAKWEYALGTYEIEGFIGLIVAVLLCWPLRRLLGRSDDYYDVEGDHD